MQQTKKIDKDKQRYKQSLKAILKWNFTTDGRKFNGDHKEVVKRIMDYARLGLSTTELKKINKKK